VFIKGGILYYVPLKEPLNAFDSSLFVEKKNNGKRQQKEEASEATATTDIRFIQSEFDPGFVNEKQFLNLVNNYMMSGFLNSEIYVNDLVTFVKDNFAENQYEKLSKLKKVSDQLFC
jgi:hypothetical protein